MQMSSISTDQSIAGLWAKKYYQKLSDTAEASTTAEISGRKQVTEKLLDMLRFASSRAWSKTENLLFEGLQKHAVNPHHIDPWQIAEDSRLLFEKACTSYEAKLTPERFSVEIAHLCGQIRQKHAAQDPRIVGFLSMQFHYTGLLLLEELPVIERVGVADYLKVMDDHLYMPLHRSYEAAAEHAYDSPALMAVQQLLPLTTRIAEYICAQVADENPTYRCHHGLLIEPSIKTSSIRDTEMFQTYLCLCALEGNMAAVQQELFPLCVMIYPPLNVHWILVRQLITLMQQEMQRRLTPENYEFFRPYLKAFQDMYAEDVLPDDDPIWSHHPDTIRFMDMARNLMKEMPNK